MEKWVMAVRHSVFRKEELRSFGMKICSVKLTFSSFDNPNVLFLASASSVTCMFPYAFKLCALLEVSMQLASIMLILMEKTALLSLKSADIALVACIP